MRGVREACLFVVSVTIFVKPESVRHFIEATLDNASNSRHEPGNVRFDVLQAEDDPTRFMLDEAYLTKDDFVRHQQTEHYARWKAVAPDLMAKPRDSVKHHALFFGDGPV